MTRLLIADDDAELTAMLAEYLVVEGFEVEQVHDGDSALQEAHSGGYDLMVLDVMMPGLNGFDVLRKLRADSQLPVLMLTARDTDLDSVVGLELGADDYLPKPCNPRVLVARIRAILRRGSADIKAPETGTLQVGDVELLHGQRRVLQQERPVELTSTEFAILAVLLANAGHVVDKEALSEQALGRELTRYDRSLDMHISKLRKKLGVHPDGSERILTVRGIGYQYTLRDGSQA